MQITTKVFLFGAVWSESLVHDYRNYPKIRSVSNNEAHELEKETRVFSVSVVGCLAGILVF